MTTAIGKRRRRLRCWLATGLAGCERPPMEVVQRGYRGNGMEQVVNPRLFDAHVEAQTVPGAVPPVAPAGPKAGDIYQNVQVLGDISAGEFNRLMVAITNWVSPEEGCNYCHGNDGFAEGRQVHQDGGADHDCHDPAHQRGLG
jgi:hypothetical protein